MADSLSLNLLRSGQSGTIALVNSSAALERQCQALGLAPGSEIRVLRQARGKGPMQVISQGSFFAVRAEEAKHIHVHIKRDEPVS